MSQTATTLYPVILTVPPPERDLKGRDKVRALSRHARSALRQSCLQSGLHLETFPKDENGAPLPVKGVYWSLSHKSSVVGGVASPMPVGLDLETIRPVSEALLTKVADADEWQLVGGRAADRFFRFWTAKEAVLKAVGKGIAGLSRCRIVEIVDDTRMTLVYEKTRWPVVHFRRDDLVAALTAHELDVAWTYTC
jgi:4'-phosphopantetheinyl transferase